MPALIDELSEEQNFAISGDAWDAVPVISTVSGRVLLRVRDKKLVISASQSVVIT